MLIRYVVVIARHSPATDCQSNTSGDHGAVVSSVVPNFAMNNLLYSEQMILDGSDNYLLNIPSLSKSQFYNLCIKERKMFQCREKNQVEGLDRQMGRRPTNNCASSLVRKRTQRLLGWRLRLKASQCLNIGKIQTGDRW